MLGKTVSSHFDEDLASLLEDVSKSDGHAPSRIVSTGARNFLSMSPTCKTGGNHDGRIRHAGGA